MPELDGGSDETILYVDDTEAQRYAVSRVLKRAGFRVLEAATGRQALEMAVGPDLIILDVNLPDVSGIEVCKQIKSSEASARTPVLQVSATSVNTEARVAGLEGGADAYLVQPIEPNELIATVRALLRARKAEESLWKSQLQYRLFFEANPLPCCVLDTPDLKILAVNSAAVQEYGYSREEFTTLTLLDIVSPEQSDSVLTLLPDGSFSRPLQTWKHRTKSGKQVDVEMIWAPLELNGRNARLVIVQDITEKLEREAAEKSEEIRRLLLARVLQIQEEERRRIARELHDEAGQLMTSLLVGLRSLSDVRRLADAKTQAKQLREIASDAINELGRLARGLHSSVLDDLGLETAIRRYADDFLGTHAIQVDVDFGAAPFSAFTRDEQLNLYRIIQEALTNVARHSQAKRVNIKFDCFPSEIEVTIKDDGRGLSSPGDTNPSHHLGIEGMRQRAAMLGGTLQVISGPPGGVTVDLRIPRRPDSVLRQATN